MIKRLRFRFIRISVIALTLAMVFVVGAVNIANLINVRSELRDTLELICENEKKVQPPAPEKRTPTRSKHEKNMLNEANWFSVYLSGEGEILSINLSNMREPDEDTARMLAEKAFSADTEYGHAAAGEVFHRFRAEEQLRS